MDRLIRGYRPYLFLTLLCLALFLPGLAALPPMDRDESRFAQATRQMLETGDFVKIRFQETPRHKKPVGIHWAQAASVAAFSDAKAPVIWPYRLPSLIGATLAVLFAFAAGAVLFDRRTALLGSALLASCFTLVTEAHLAKTDAFLLASVMAAQWALARFYMRERTGEAPGNGVILTFWLAIGIGILLKGPITPLIAGLTIVTLGIADRNFAWLRGLRPIMGTMLAAAVVAPWFAAISQATDGAFVGEAVKSDLLPKLLGAQESHGGKPGTYLLLLTLSFWPASLYVWPALARAWKQRSEAGLRFCLAWAVPAFLLFELIPTKLPHYVLPAYPALALIVAAALTAGHDGAWDGLNRRWAKILALIVAAVGLVLGAAFLIAPIMLGSGPSLGILLAALAGFAAFGLAAREIFRHRPIAAAAHALLAGGLCVALGLQFVLPRLDALMLSPRIAEAAAGNPHPLAAAGYHEPSLVFLMGTRTLLTGGPGAAAHILAAPGALALVADFEEEPFRAALGARSIVQVASFKGINYSRGKKIVLNLYRAGL